MATPDPLTQNIEGVLAGIGGTGTPLFARVLVCDSADAFERVAGALGGIVAGILPKPVVWGNAHDNAEDHTERCDYSILLRVNVQRAQNADDQAASDGLLAAAAAVRAALLADPSRGGLCVPIYCERRFVRATDLRGPTSVEGPKKGHAFYTATIPLACGRRVSRSFT